ncbi:N-acetylglucosamine-induced protein 1 [Neolecta irregularis DAH-3]|uniref:N-acetylglucosamine-induced protein 1 n=1 Tax=Neolecta irregularis (strain DAH-3) TaxID=1198029 RepID=A0A1U7LNE2_NEOID|nr:N-acetylglucosamine-induced protein 1 [Neolecta irregularis DAH-3]|eukprot:OLL24148.1 N-acetylglucosamine-induced protein 1 [Neolecta irregularis DAH-3]
MISIVINEKEENRIEDFHRRPSDLEDYLSWKREILKRYSTMEQYILKEVVEWFPSPTPKCETPFQDKDDYKITSNSFPYAIEPDVKHIVVWLKQNLEKDSLGYLSKEVYRLVDGWVKQTFGADNDVLWFNNSTALRSVAGLEHFHVLLKGWSDEKFMEFVQKS